MSSNLFEPSSNLSSNFFAFGDALTDFMKPFVDIADGASTLLGLIN